MSDTATDQIHWNENGDHPAVRYYRHPEWPGGDRCPCGHIMHDHGWIDEGPHGFLVCPGDIVIGHEDGHRAIHPTGRFSWTQPQCGRCWTEANPDRTPAKMKASPVAKCVTCGDPTQSGIWIRTDPNVAPHPSEAKD